MSPTSRTRMLRTLACAVTLSATILVAGSECDFGVGVAYAPAGDGDYPPEAFIATTEPVYFEGHAAYWYGNSWYYRDGDHWNHYNREPQALHQRRMQAPPQQRTYGPPRGRPAPVAQRPGRPPAVQRNGRHR